ncbi:replication factor C subunit 3-like [Zingiber officinale]|uniref:replication factor C subunit 3-like n=1 Tax=Zingiber officinale TaxID=94328 RepID=UPI001C4CE53E|nr:replication factor C subunit 3-like [Zingiber officinale]XP_042434313.1 replication factor C subunit 3-like [Zingiber officinale]XP_042434320.1 replication factor C subunit 3-like [Zingiber officinale]XP_042434329.1 replication factor C subunit 3-like [Zingiber officinale]XP_042434336.1 replication factor C subunit 3-like [Zingiber officinale]XP_042434344.1 replication factor C subunit 3-like [Zingiber officinale]
MKQGFAWEGKRRQLVAVWGSPFVIASPFEIAGPTSTSLSSRLSEVNPMAIRSFEASWKSNYSLKENKDILTSWEDVIAGIVKSLIKEQSPKQLYIIRGKLKNLIEHDVSPDFIFSTLFEELKKHLDEHLKAKAEFLYHKYQYQQDSDKWNDSKKNLRYFMRIEEFTAHFKSLYKSFITKSDTEPKH